MAASPRFKVYRGREYVASCKYPEDAAALCAVSSGIETTLAEAVTIRLDHKHILWTEGFEEQLAGESYDFVAHKVYERLDALERQLSARFPSITR